MPLALPTAWIPHDLRLSNGQAENISVVYACIRAIAEALASSPWLVFTVQDRNREVSPDDPLAYLLNQRPNSETTAIAFKEALIHWALSEGNGYAEIQRSPQGQPIALWPLLADRMIPWRNTDDDSLWYRYLDPAGATHYLPERDVFHLRGPVSASALLGDSVVGRASRSAALMSAAQRFGLNYLNNGAQPTGVLTFPGKLDEKSFSRIREQVAERTAGVKNGGKPLLLEGGMKFEPTQSDPSKAMMVDTLVWATEDIARYFGVPLVKLGVQAAAQGYGTNVSQLNLEWTRTGLRPWALRLEQEANAKLFPVRQRGAWRETCIDMDWLVRGDAKEQAEADEIRIRSGVDSVNSVLERLGRNTIGPEGDIRFVGTNVQPLTVELLEIQAKQAEQGEPAMPEDPAEDPAMVDPTQDPAEDQGDDPAQAGDMAATAQALLVASLERYGARIRARRRDLVKNHAEDRVEALILEERERIAPGIRAEVEAVYKLAGRPPPNGALSVAFSSVESGVESSMAVAQLWGAP